MQNYETLKYSYLKSVKITNSGTYFDEIFNKTADKLKEIKFLGCCVEVNLNRNSISFTLILDSFLSVEITRIIDKEDVIFSLSRDKQLLVSNVLKFDDFIDSLEKLQKQIGEKNGIPNNKTYRQVDREKESEVS